MILGSTGRLVTVDVKKASSSPGRDVQLTEAGGLRHAARSSGL
jgi:hypothetical protein